MCIYCIKTEEMISCTQAHALIFWKQNCQENDEVFQMLLTVCEKGPLGIRGPLPLE